MFDFVSRTTPTGGDGARLPAQHDGRPVPLQLSDGLRTRAAGASLFTDKESAAGGRAFSRTGQAALAGAVAAASSATAVDWTIAA